MKRLSAAVVLVGLLGLGGCAHFYQEPLVHFTGVRVVGLGVNSGTAQIHLEVENPNRFALEVSELRYHLEVAERSGAWTELASGSSVEPVRLDRRSNREVVLTVPFQYRGVGSALMAFLSAGEVPYRVRGDVMARGPTGEIALPFRSQGSLGR